MIIIIGRFQVRSERLADFQVFARAIVPEGRQVEGCLSFDILQDLAAPDWFVMLEQWADRDALDQHFESEAYARNDTALSTFVADEPEWEEYEI